MHAASISKNLDENCLKNKSLKIKIFSVNKFYVIQFIIFHTFMYITWPHIAYLLEKLMWAAYELVYLHKRFTPNVSIIMAIIYII